MPTSRGRNQRAARLGHDAAAGEHEAELGVLAGEADVHRQRHRHADTDGRAVDRTDHRLRALEDAQRHQPTAVAGHADVGRDLVAATPAERLATAGQVGTGAEAAAGTGDDDHAHVVVGVDAIERVDQLAHHHARERVELVGAVQRDGRDVVGHRRR